MITNNDGGDCRRPKAALCRLCKDGGRKDTLVRIACQELEAWYLGEPEALADAYGEKSLRVLQRRARFREPDTIQRPSAELSQLIPAFQKVSEARLLARHLTRERNRSPSFHALVRSLTTLAGQFLPTHEGTAI